MGFNIELEAKDWKRLAKTAVRGEVHGNGSNSRPLLQLLQEVTERQKRWHENCAQGDHMHSSLFRPHDHDHKKSCEALGAERLRQSIENMNWD